MIIDKIENATLYVGLSDRIATAFSFLKNTDFDTLADGKYDVDNKNVFAIVSEYTPKDVNECKPETHFEHIDIQYIISGEEQIGLVTRTTQTPVNEYPEKDVAFYKTETTLHPFKKGMFGIFFPNDIHQPGVALNGNSTVRKVVMKIRVN